MKRTIISLTVFIIVFAVAYLGLCFLIPGFRIKLAAEPMDYFIASIRHSVLLKSIISFILGAIATAFPFILLSKEKE